MPSEMLFNRASCCLFSSFQTQKVPHGVKVPITFTGSLSPTAASSLWHKRRHERACFTAIVSTRKPHDVPPRNRWRGGWLRREVEQRWTCRSEQGQWCGSERGSLSSSFQSVPSVCFVRSRLLAMSAWVSLPPPWPAVGNSTTVIPVPSSLSLVRLNTRMKEWNTWMQLICSSVSPLKIFLAYTSL